LPQSGQICQRIGAQPPGRRGSQRVSCIAVEWGGVGWRGVSGVGWGRSRCGWISVRDMKKTTQIWPTQHSLLTTLHFTTLYTTHLRQVVKDVVSLVDSLLAFRQNSGLNLINLLVLTLILGTLTLALSFHQTIHKTVCPRRGSGRGGSSLFGGWRPWGGGRNVAKGIRSSTGDEELLRGS